MSATMRFLASGGLAECLPTGASIKLCTAALARRGRPFVASRQTSAFERVQFPRPQNQPCPLLFRFAQQKARVL